MVSGVLPSEKWSRNSDEFKRPNKNTLEVNDCTETFLWWQITLWCMIRQCHLLRGLNYFLVNLNPNKSIVKQWRMKRFFLIPPSFGLGRLCNCKTQTWYIFVYFRMFPSLVNCCTIDWFTEWPHDALEKVVRTSACFLGFKRVAHFYHFCVGSG